MKANQATERLYSYSMAFRTAIEECRPAAADLDCLKVMVGFPTGCCGPSSQLLARFLNQELSMLPASIHLAANGCRNGQRHAWLETNQLIVDISADQFEDQASPVIVTADREWHGSFKGVQLFEYGDFMRFNEAFRSEFDLFYAAVLRHVFGPRPFVSL